MKWECTGLASVVTFHIARVCEWVYAYMYICTLLDTMRFKVVRPWTYQKFTVKHASGRVVLGWVISWEVWFGGVKSGQYCIVGSGSLQMILESLSSLRWRECAQSHKGCQWGRWVPRYGNEYMLICIFAHFLTQHILNLWWPWIYQNYAIKRAYTRVIPGWVTF
jgi:hypothetical protein